MNCGHVKPNADGSRARCGGPGICTRCNQELGAEFARLRLLVPKDVHELCHELQGVTAQAFCDGCEKYQKNIYGESPISVLKDSVKASALVLDVCLHSEKISGAGQSIINDLLNKLRDQNLYTPLPNSPNKGVN